MDKNELKTQVAALVDDLFNEKEEAEIRKQTQAELEKAASTISDLTSALEDKNSEFAEMEDKLNTSDARKKELESELEAAKVELEKANTKLEETVKEFEGMKKDRAAELRMTELEDAGVARSEKENQMAKIREMSNEDFASYKDELVSIREAVLAELKKTQADEKAEADAKAEAEEAKKMKKDEEVVDDEEEDMKGKKFKKEKDKKEKCSDTSETTDEKASEEETTTIPAQITPGQAAMASLNMEFIPSEDIMAKYAKLGQAMAKKFQKS
jgi:hypothetical protein